MNYKEIQTNAFMITLTSTLGRKLFRQQ